MASSALAVLLVTTKLVMLWISGARARIASRVAVTASVEATGSIGKGPLQHAHGMDRLAAGQVADLVRGRRCRRRR